MSEDASGVNALAAEGRLPLSLSALLSWALVAYTIEFDNESEHQVPHRTTDYGRTPGALSAPWLVSLVMWSNCMRFVDEAGITIAELERRAGTPTNLDGMRRWGYLTIELGAKASASKRPHPDAILRATAGGLRAREIWRPLFGVIETRWRERFDDAIDSLRATLWAVADQFETELPDCLPILHYGLRTSVSEGAPRTPAASADTAVPELTLAALLSKVLLRFTLPFERVSPVSLAISADVLRLIPDEGTRVRDLPRLAGVSKEAIAMALTFLERQEYATVQVESPESRVKAITLTPNGRRLCDAYAPLVWGIEERWQARFGEQALAIANLCEALEREVGVTEPSAALLSGLEPYPEGWRAKLPRPATLPHFPMVLHRGGYPDGS